MKKDKDMKFYWEEPYRENRLTNEAHIKIDVPGFKKDEIKVTVKNNVLSVSARKKSQKTEKGKNFYRQESFVSSFEKSMTLPFNFDAKMFDLNVNDGSIKIRKKKKMLEEKA